MVGPDLHAWDDVGIVMYPNLDKFIEMVNFDWYKEAIHHREAGLRDTRLITCYNMPRSIRLQLWFARWFGKFLFRLKKGGNIAASFLILFYSSSVSGIL